MSPSARTLARALADADGGYEAELRRQATLALGAVQALLDSSDSSPVNAEGDPNADQNPETEGR
jgi:hypothetical protein